MAFPPTTAPTFTPPWLTGPGMTTGSPIIATAILYTIANNGTLTQSGSAFSLQFILDSISPNYDTLMADVAPLDLAVNNHVPYALDFSLSLTETLSANGGELAAAGSGLYSANALRYIKMSGWFYIFVTLQVGTDVETYFCTIGNYSETLDRGASKGHLTLHAAGYVPGYNP